MVGLAGEVESPPAVRPDRGGHADGCVEVDKGAALLDVQLDEHADPVQRLVVPPERGGVGACGAHRLGQAHAVAVAQFPGRIRVEQAGEQAAAHAGDAEARTFLVGEVHHGERPVRGDSPLA